MTDAPADIRFRLGGKVYTTADLDEVTLKHIVLLERQAADLGVPVRWGQIEQAQAEMSQLDGSRDSHPDAALLFAITIWASRVLAGETITFEDAIDVPIKAIEFLDSPTEPAPGAAARPTTARKGTRKASGRAGASGPAAGRTATTATSASPSVDA